MKIYDSNEIKGRNAIDILNSYDDLSIFRKKGLDSSKSVFVSTILHGCEPCGLNAVLRELETEQQYEKDVYFMIGNVQAARYEKPFTHRLLPDGQNFNRIWTENTKTNDERKALEVLKEIKKLNLDALIDLHSFTALTGSAHCYISGDNSIQLDFAQKIAPFIFKNGDDDGLLIDRTSSICPSLLVECGTNGTKTADEFAYRALQKFFTNFNVIKNSDISLEKLTTNVYTGEQNFKFKTSDIEFGIKPIGTKIIIREDIESLNIVNIKAGDFFGYGDNLEFLTSKSAHPSYYFFISEGEVRFNKDCTINLFSKHPQRLVESGFYIYDRN